MNTEQLRGFVSLETRKKELDAELKGVKQQLDDLEQLLIPQFIEAGFDSVKVDGRTVSLVQEVYASPLYDRAEVVAALKKSDLGQYVAENYHTNSVAAFVREVAREVRERCRQEDRMFDEAAILAALPAPLGPTLKISFVHSLRSRKA